MINIDMWHNDKIKAVEKINIFFNDLTGKYWGNCYINNKAIGDYTADSSTDIEKAFGLFVSRLVIGYGGLFLFFY